MNDGHFFLVRRHTNDRLVNRDGSVLKIEGDYVNEVLEDCENRYGIDLEPISVDEFEQKWGESKSD